MPSKRSTNESVRSALMAIREPLMPKFSTTAPPSNAPRCEVQEMSLPPAPHPLSPHVVESPKQQMVDSLKFFVSIIFSSSAHWRPYRHGPFIRSMPRGYARAHSATCESSHSISSARCVTPRWCSPGHTSCRRPSLRPSNL